MLAYYSAYFLLVIISKKGDAMKTYQVVRYTETGKFHLGYFHSQEDAEGFLWTYPYAHQCTIVEVILNTSK